MLLAHVHADISEALKADLARFQKQANTNLEASSKPEVSKTAQKTQFVHEHACLARNGICAKGLCSCDKCSTNQTQIPRP